MGALNPEGAYQDAEPVWFFSWGSCWLIAARLFQAAGSALAAVVANAMVRDKASGQAATHRGWYGSDGSDQMSFIVLASGAAAELMPQNERNAALLSSFVGFQSLLSYFASGAAKVVSPSWRDGSAVEGVFRTQTYGDEVLYGFLTENRWGPKAMSRTVTAVEVLYPAIVLMPKTLHNIGLGIGAAFHIANARYMGLNRFFGAFCGSYPSIISAAEAIRSSKRDRTRC